MHAELGDAADRIYHRRPLPDLASYGALSMPIAMAGLVLLTYLPTYYALNLGIGLYWVGIVFAAGRILDVVTDPVIGHLSDQTRTRFGPRKPWMAVGILGFCGFFWLLVAPPASAGIGYLILTGGGFFLFLTMLAIPYSAVGLELSEIPDERTSLASAKATFEVSGALLAGAFPLLLGATVAASLPTIGLSVLVLSVLGFLLFIWRIPVAQRTQKRQSANFKKALKSLKKNRDFRFLIGTFGIIQLANAFFAGLAVLYIQIVLGSEAMVGALIALMFVATAIFLPLWQNLSRRWGKLASWRVAIIVSCLALCITPFVGPGDIALAGLLFFVMGSTFGGDAILPTSMLADLTYKQESEGNLQQAGLFLAVKNAVSKLSFVAPMAIAFPVLGQLEFEAQGASDPALQWAFLLFFAAVPLLLKLLALTMLRSEGAKALQQASS